MTMTPTTSPDVDLLLARLCDDPDSETLKLILADALDECGMCGVAMRWAAECERKPWNYRHRLCSWCDERQGAKGAKSALPSPFWDHRSDMEKF